MFRSPHRALNFLALGGALLLSSCYGSGYGGPHIGIFVTFQTVLPPSVNVGSNFIVAAIVTNDNSHSGVNWTAACGGIGCGSFSSPHTASGAATTFTAPSSVPAGSTVTIVATSAADAMRSASGNVIVSAGTEAITFAAPPPPSTLSTAAGFNTAPVAAVVTNDPLNQGVDWSVSCASAGACGGFSLAHTASTVSTTYTAPPAVPSGSTVTITAQSTTDPAVSVSTVVTLGAATPAAFLCAGCSYTYFISGTETSGPANGSFYTMAGVFTADGMGNITAGEQDFSDAGFVTGNTPDSITGHYTFGPDGRGTITLDNGDAKILNGGGVETLSVAMLSANHMLLAEQDNFATGSGTMDLQSLSTFSQATLSGGYAFVFGGSDLSSSVPLAFGGVFNVDSPGAISGAGSVADANYSGAVSTQQGLTGSYPMPDTSGRVLLTLRSSVFGNVGPGGPAIMAAYITDAAHLKCMEIDSNFGISAGLAVGQGSNTGKLSGSTVLPVNSSYVFSVFGESGSVLGPISLVTTFTSDGVSNLQNGVSDVNNGGIPSSGSVSGTYTVAASGTGRVAVNLSGNTSALSQFAVYLTGGPDPAMVIELDSKGVTSGQNFPQSAGPFMLPSFRGPYGLNFSAFNPVATAEEDVTGQLLADGSGNLAATLDLNANGVPVPNAPATGNYASAASGRFTGSLTSMPTGPFQLSYFLVSPSQIVFTQTDTNGVTIGFLQSQSPPF